MSLFFLAIAAGMLTVLAPCILPVLPIILGVGAGARTRPLWVVVGFIASFSIAGAIIQTTGGFVGINPVVLRYIAVVLLSVFGLALIFEQKAQQLAAPITSRLSQMGGKLAGAAGSTGAIASILVGVSLGLVWTPCAGPILGTIITLAVASKDTVATTVLFAAYALGAAVPMLAIAYGGQRVMTRMRNAGPWAHRITQAFGILIILVAVAMATGIDTKIQAMLIQWYPQGILLL